MRAIMITPIDTKNIYSTRKSMIPIMGVFLTFCVLLIIGGCGDQVKIGAIKPADPVIDHSDLSNLGYDATPVSGERPLLYILTSFSDTPPFDRDYYSLFFGEREGPIKTATSLKRDESRTAADDANIVGLFESVSGGNFRFQPAGGFHIVFDQTQETIDANMSESEYDQAVLRKAWDFGNGFPFNDYDADGDGTITHEELAIVVINPSTGCGGQTRWVDVSGVAPNSGAIFRYNGQISQTHGDGDMDLYAHELFHQLEGGEHIYGPGASRNYEASFYAASHCASGAVGPYHLDPWFKIRLGWLKPRVLDVSRLAGSLTIELSPSAPMPNAELSPVILYDSNRGLEEFFILEYRTPQGYDEGVGSLGLAVWYVKHKSGSNQLFEFNWPPPFTDPFSGSGDHMFADYLIGVDGPGTTHFWRKDDGEFSLEWGNGDDSDLRLKVLNEITATSPVLEVMVK